MLSPDVPEFIPRCMRGPENSNISIAVSNEPVAISEKNNSAKDEPRKYSQSNSGRSTKSWQNRNSTSKLGQQTYTKILKRDEAPKKSTVASRLFKEQYREELWPSLPGADNGQSAPEEMKGKMESEARISSFPSQINDTRNELPQEKSNFWQKRNSSNIQQNVSINQEHLDYSKKTNDLKNMSNSHVLSEDGKVPHTIPISRKSRKVNNQKNISNENSKDKNPIKSKSENFMESVHHSESVYNKNKNSRKPKSENIVQNIHQSEVVNDENKNYGKSKSENVLQNVHQYESDPVHSIRDIKNNSQATKSSQSTDIVSVHSVRDIQNNLQATKSSQSTENVSENHPGDEEWQVQKDRKRKKQNTDKQKTPDACGENTKISNIRYKNKERNYNDKDKAKSDGNLFQKNKSSGHSRKEVDNIPIEKGKNKTIFRSSKEDSPQNAQYKNSKEMESRNDKIKGFEMNKKDIKDSRKVFSSKKDRKDFFSKKDEVKKNVANELNLKTRKLGTDQHNSQKDNLESSKEQDKCESVKQNDNTLSKQMPTEEFEKFKAERKLKRKEEKIRKRELRLRKEMAMSRGDSKVMVITREFLEAMTSKSSSSSQINNEVKEKYTNIDHDYPTLDVGGDGYPNNEGKLITNKLKETKLLDVKSGKKVEVNLGNSSEESNSGSIDHKPAFSYSSALVTSKKKTVTKSTIKEKPVKESKPMEKKPPKTSDLAAPQKKLKMKDRIEYDLMAAIGAKPTKQKKKSSDLKQVSLGSSSTKSKGLVALGSKIRGATAAAQPKRGKQREDQKRKKKMSVLKKRMKENQGIDGQSLVGLLMQAKQLGEVEINSSISSPDHFVDSSKELMMEHENCSDNIDVVPCDHSIKQLGITNSETNILEKLEQMEGNLQGKDFESNVTFMIDSDNNGQQPEVMNESVKSTKDVFPLVSDSVSNSQYPIQKLSQEVSEKCQELVKEIIELQDPVHKNSFREYCNHVLTPELDTKAQALIEALVRFQERQYLKDPIKARIRRRYVCGLKETIKLMGKMSCILVAPDITRSKGPGALDERVEQVLCRARESAVPVIFVLSKRKLGRISRKKGTVSSFGIINYQGAQDSFNEMMELVPGAKHQYEQLVDQGRLTRPTPDIDCVSDDDVVDNSVGIGEVHESNDKCRSDGNPKEILDINRRIMNNLMISS